MIRPIGAAGLLLITLPVLGLAEDEAPPIDEIVVAGNAVATDTATIEVEQKMLLDTAIALKAIPGADVNSNGLITGIAQYRGMYGDRVAVTIDGHAVVSGGPNAMDSPFAYVSPMITEAVVVNRGIAGVSAAAESIGGHLNARLARGNFGGEEFGISGFMGSRYATNGNVATSAGRLTLSNSSHRISALTEIDSGNDIKTTRGDIRPSRVDRRRYDLSYAYANGEDHLVVFAGKLDTGDSGTPALPMDIRYIDTNLYGAHFLHTLSPMFAIEGRVSANDVEHLMDNFALRSAPPAMMQRQTLATGSGTTFAFAGNVDFSSSTLRVGIEGTVTDHEAIITNPNNSAFRVVNFSDVERDLTSIFGEWVIDRNHSELELGISVKQVKTDAGDVAAAGVMNPSAAALSDAFNGANRKLSFEDVDVIAKYRYRFGDNIEGHAGIARKSRAPSFQELYLWLPMQATGGLADGRSYIGDLSLDAEVSHELNVGLSSTLGRLSLAPQIFYKRVDDYIQGTPSANDNANMVATMMAGRPALQFSNTDADIWGTDLAWSFQISERIAIDGAVSYSRGRRTDIADNLYRLAPLKGSIGLTYTSDRWVIDTHILAYDEQKKVASFNDEQPTAGYAVVSGGFAWMPVSSLRLEARIGNLFDADYQDHLAGINRAGGSDISVGDRLYGSGRTLTAGVIFDF
jgi:iron complex outermembrane receptor protein